MVNTDLGLSNKKRYELIADLLNELIRNTEANADTTLDAKVLDNVEVLGEVAELVVWELIEAYKKANALNQYGSAWDIEQETIKHLEEIRKELKAVE